MNIKETIYSEIEARREHMVYELYGLEENTTEYQRLKGMHDAYVDMLTYLTYSLPEQPDSEEKFRNLLDAMGDCGFSQENILLLKSIWEDAGCQIPQRKQPVEWLEEEINKEIDKLDITPGYDRLAAFARHFAEWGASHAKTPTP